jgi:hypothetical protein
VIDYNNARWKPEIKTVQSLKKEKEIPSHFQTKA